MTSINLVSKNPGAPNLLATMPPVMPSQDPTGPLSSQKMPNGPSRPEVMEMPQTITKERAWSAVKRIAMHLGLKPAQVLLIDTLLTFSQSQDWEDDYPIVWPSNRILMERTGFSLSALKRHVRRLVDFGLIVSENSVNGKRWGQRDLEGRIIEAYGFDLTPLQIRAEEFEAVDRTLHAERTVSDQLRRGITRMRGGIRASLKRA